MGLFPSSWSDKLDRHVFKRTVLHRYMGKGVPHTLTTSGIDRKETDNTQYVRINFTRTLMSGHTITSCEFTRITKGGYAAELLNKDGKAVAICVYEVPIDFNYFCPRWVVDMKEDGTVFYCGVGIYYFKATGNGVDPVQVVDDTEQWRGDNANDIMNAVPVTVPFVFHSN